MSRCVEDMSRVCKMISDCPTPLILPDTCALLDVLRLTPRARDSDYARRAIKALRMLKTLAGESPPRVVIATPDAVNSERNRNQGVVEAEVSAHLEKLQTAYSLALQCTDFSNPVKSFPSVLVAAQLLKDELMTFLECSFQLAAHKDSVFKAYRRNLEMRPPARQGENSIDCVIFEDVLAVAQELRMLGVNTPIYFVTSNVKDYFDGSIPKEQITEDLHGLQVELCTSWEAVCWKVEQHLNQVGKCEETKECPVT